MRRPSIAKAQGGALWSMGPQELAVAADSGADDCPSWRKGQTFPPQSLPKGVEFSF